MSFVHGGSWDNGVFIVRSVIEYFIEYDSNIYAVTLY